MLIQCTKKLLDELKIKPNSEKIEELLFSWHANLSTVNRRKTIVLVNDSSRYIVVLHGLKIKDLKNIDEIILNSIRETLIAESIKEEIVAQFIDYSPEIVYTKTKDRSSVAKLNKACETVNVFADGLNNNTIYQIYLSIKVSAYMIADRAGGYVYPYETMYNNLENFAKQPIFSCKSVELKITLNIADHKIWRRVIVPVNISFKKLHDIIQIAFGWQNYHLHEFYIFSGNKPIVNLVCCADAFEYPNDVTMILDNDVKLSEYIPKYTRVEYNYDFGDNWNHSIEIGKIIEGYGWNYPICLCGEGNTPPEDVGGDYGYEEFLEAILDTSHSEHDDMVNWGKMQRYGEFNIEFVNTRLKDTLKDLWQS